MPVGLFCTLKGKSDNWFGKTARCLFYMVIAKPPAKIYLKKKKSFQSLLSLSSCPQHPLFSHPKISLPYFIPDCKISIKSETWQELGEQFLSKGETNLKRILVIFKYLKTATTKSKFCVSDTFMYWSNRKQLFIKIQFCKSVHFHKENYPLKLLLKGHLACRDLPPSLIHSR